MRIAQALPAGAHPYSGVPTVVIQLAVHLGRLGHHVEVWCLQPLSAAERAVYEPALADANVALVPAPSGGLRGLTPLLRRAVDVVHMHSVFSTGNSLLAARLRVPYVLSPHGGYASVCLTRSRVRKSLYAFVVERRMVRRAALTVALTRAEAQDLVTFGARKPIRIIPNGVRPAPADVDRRAFRARLGLAAATPLLLFVGRLDVFHKGLDQLVSALATAPGWHAALVGSDVRGGQQAIMRSAQERGVGSRLTFVGPLHGERLEETFAAADLFVLPSRWEGLPMSLLEALSHGLPALVTPPVEQALGVAAAGAGWVAAPHEIGAVLRALATLDEHYWAERRRAARVLAAQFQWPAVARQYAAAYAACIGTPHAQ